MPSRRGEQDESERRAKAIDRDVKRLDAQIDDQLRRLADLRGGLAHYALLLESTGTEIRMGLVDRVYDDLRQAFGSGGEKLLVAVTSAGGDIHAAYNLATLFRRYERDRLEFVVPRYAKSAATLLVCGGDEILLTPIAELGPLDPQITEVNPLDHRMEQFSPLHIKSTLDLINEQFREGNEKTATSLVNRLQFPLTLGSYRKALDVGKDYMAKLVSTRMISNDDGTKADEIGKSLVEGYADHSACIKCQEATDLGLVVHELDGDQLDLAWEMHRLDGRKGTLLREKRRIEMKKRVREIPPEILELLSNEEERSAFARGEE